MTGNGPVMHMERA